MTFNPGTDVFNQPLRDAWWTPGWTAQNQSYIPVPPNVFLERGFPSSVTYVSVTGNYFDMDGNFNSGFLTFFPSNSLTFSDGTLTTTLEQRFVGQNVSFIGLNQFGSGKVYLWNGQLQVTLLATDNVNMTPPAFSYHVTEHWQGGREFDIAVPKANSVNNSTGTDINSLIIPGSISGQTLPHQNFAAVSTQYVVADITETAGTIQGNPTSFPVNFAFIPGNSQPASNQWHSGIWATSSVPYVAKILVGPNNSGLVLSAGSYSIWVQVVTATQVPAIQIGTLTIF